MLCEELFRPIDIGHATISHRVVMAPLTRFRADHSHVPGPHTQLYYEQRTSEPGTLIITEGVFVSPRAGGYRHVPGIWNDKQTARWAEIVDGVHRKGGIIYIQLWALGRVAQPDVLLAAEGGPYEVSSASVVAIEAGQSPATNDRIVPVELSNDEIEQYIADYAHAASNAVKAGFDGIEIHAANGYLIDQFSQDVTNVRNDKWGGSIENRARFVLEVTRAVIKATHDSQKVAVRLSPYGIFQGMGMIAPLPQFTHIVKQLQKLDLAYLHLIESRAWGSAADGVYHDRKGTEELKPLIKIWGSKRPVVLAGGFTPAKAAWVMKEFEPSINNNLMIAFGRYYISTPDLPYRLRRGLELNPWDRSTFYTPGPAGYTDYPFSKEYLTERGQDGHL